MRIASLRPRRPLPPKLLPAPMRLSLVWLAAILVACTDHRSPTAPVSRAVPLEGLLAGAPLNVPAQGQYIFRHWTFGDEPFWTDTLRLNEVVEAAVSPATALAVGLKVDAERLPRGFLARADLTSPATTVELLRRDAVVGVEADVTADRHIKRLGITCALCHSTVDNGVTLGVGRRLAPTIAAQLRRRAEPHRSRACSRERRSMFPRKVSTSFGTGRSATNPSGPTRST